MPYIKFSADEALMEEIRDFYEAPSYPNKKNPYLVFQVKTLDNVQVTCYKSKEIYTLMFSGDRNKIIDEALIFIDNPVVIDEKTINKDYLDNSYQIGTDEVGVGDFFGPLVVAATYVTPENLNLIEKLGIKDSKKLTDTKILEIGPIVEKYFLHEVCLCSPKKLVDLKNNGWNMHKIMANLHNTAQNNLLSKIKVNPSTKIYIDEFSNENLYFKYLVTNKPNLPIHFETKGESLYPSVACSSVLARYHFLKIWEKMNEYFKTEIPKGAGEEVDKTVQKLLRKYSLKDLKPYMKTFFRNYKDIEK
ncbi:ribonuclease HIII [Firmicutes bacterium CAG:345]|jgi:ribonuclease HII|nr:ribonuclease HIII [Firmicutes bacterium CAG:345]